MGSTEFPLIRLEEHERTIHSFDIENVGSEDINYSFDISKTIEVEQRKPTLKRVFEHLNVLKGELDPRAGSVNILGSGGPDLYGYSWIDSQESLGPSFNWVDIQSTGDIVQGLNDDSVSAAIDIGFDFDFYGETYDQLYISSNGFISFSPIQNSGCCTGQPLPNGDQIHNIIAWLWKDLHPRSGSVYTQTLEGNQFVIQFVNYGEYSGGGVINAEVILYSSGEIKLQYLTLENGVENRLYSIGIENEDSTDGLQVAFNNSYLSDELAISISPGVSWLQASPKNGVLHPGETQRVELEYSAKVGLGDFAAGIVLNSNDPNQQSIPFSVHLSVEQDKTPGAPVSDLAASLVSFDKVELNWTAVADHGFAQRQLDSYLIRYSESPINIANWDQAEQFGNVIPPGELGYVESAIVDGLNADTTYFFAIKTVDVAGNESNISNVLEVSTGGAPIASVSTAPIDVVLMEGIQGLRSLVVSNTGDTPLEFNIRIDELDAALIVDPAKTQLRYAQGRNTATQTPRVTRVIDSLPPAGTYQEKHILVGFIDGHSAQEVTRLRNLFSASLVKEIGALNIELWEIESNGDLIHVISELTAHSQIEFAEPNFKVNFNEIPSDLLFEDLWGLHNTGQSLGTEDADIDAVEAWDISTGSHNTIVAVIDTGIDYLHPDLAGNIWTNTEEIPNNQIDDDNNGYVDDIHGYDFVNDDGDPMDDNNHGTHVAGTIGAIEGNSQGVVGVNHQVSLMGIKFLSAWGSGNTDDAVDGIIYAVDNGAHILNNSWGGGPFSQTLVSAIEYARDHDVLFVAAAGNSAFDNDHTPSYPASYEVDNVLAVAATDRNDQLASFSQYGLVSVDIGAPGVDIWSTVPNDAYESFSGTSMASPHVAGAAALVKSFNSSVSVSEIKDILMESSDPLPSLEGVTVSGGRLNLERALRLTGPRWVRMSGEMLGVVLPGESIQLDLAFNAENIDVGLVQANILITSNDPEATEIRVPVSLTVTPDVIPPAVVVDLAAVDVMDISAQLGFTASGDDGHEGRADYYDVRYGLSPITEENWASSLPVSLHFSPSLAGEAELITVNGLPPNSRIWLGLKVVDNVGLESGLSNIIEFNTLNAELTISPAVVPRIRLSQGEVGSATIDLENTGEVDIRAQVYVDSPARIESQMRAQFFSNKKLLKGEVDPRVGMPVVQGRGGPDTFGYKWVDSNELNATDFNWIDISETGTLVSGLFDDSVSESLDIGFDFPFYGEAQQQVRISSNGFISFSEFPASGCCAGDPIPTQSGRGDKLVAWLWYDLHPRSGLVHYQSLDESAFVIQFSDYGEFSGTGTINAQIILNSNGEIKLQYRDIQGGMNVTRASIGIENSDGTDGLQVAFNTSYVEENLAVLISPFWLKVTPPVLELAPGEIGQLQLHVNTGTLELGVHESELVVRSNDNVNPEQIRRIELEVVD